MKKRQKMFSAAMILLILGLTFLFLYQEFYDSGNVVGNEYSVILYQYTDSDWTSLLEGIRQAAEDENVVVNFVTMPVDGTVENEIELLEREVENGADGILMAAVDSALLKEKTEEISRRIPVVTVETGVGEEPADVCADDYEMGYLLGSSVAEDMKKTGEYSVYVIQEYMQRYSVARRYQGFLDALEEQAPDALIIPYCRSKDDYNLPVCIRNMYATGASGAYVAAFDKYCTEALAQSSDSPDPDMGILKQRAFGIGNTQRTVSSLDEGSLRGLVYQNEFNMGYLGLIRLIRESRSRKTENQAEIDYYYVTRETLYDAENQRLLFPIK